LCFWNLDTGQRIRVLDGHTDSIVSASLFGNERRAVSASLDNTLRVWDLDTGACLALIRLGAPCDAVAVTRDQRRIVAGTSTGDVFVFDVRGI
jgi:WD40 repeat protein